MNACQHFISEKPEAWIVILHALLALFGSWDNIKISYGLDSTGFISWLELDIFFSQTSSRPALGRTSLLFMDWGSFPLVRQLAHEVDQFSLSSTEVKNEWICTSTPPLCLHGMHKDFTFFYRTQVKC
jgi:hypothetical protein